MPRKPASSGFRPARSRTVRALLAQARRHAAVDATVLITVASLPIEVLERAEAYLAPSAGRRPTLDEVERRYIELTLRHVKGSRIRAAEILGISRKALWEKRKRYGLQ